jgi:hypothetical protein
MKDMKKNYMREKEDSRTSNVGLILRCIMECELFTEIKELN